MSRIGIGANRMQPSSQCLSCKRWCPAGRLNFPNGWQLEGKCSLGYCEKTRNNKKNGKRRQK